MPQGGIHHSSFFTSKFARQKPRFTEANSRVWLAIIPESVLCLFACTWNLIEEHHPMMIFLGKCKKNCQKKKPYFNSNILLQCCSSRAAVCLLFISISSEDSCPHRTASPLRQTMVREPWDASAWNPTETQDESIRQESISAWRHIAFELKTCVFSHFALPLAFSKYFFLLVELCSAGS